VLIARSVEYVAVTSQIRQPRTHCTSRSVQYALPSLGNVLPITGRLPLLPTVNALSVWLDVVNRNTRV
jgi:hypothetical protein